MVAIGIKLLKLTTNYDHEKQVIIYCNVSKSEQNSKMFKSLTTNIKATLESFQFSVPIGPG